MESPGTSKNKLSQKKLGRAEIVIGAVLLLVCLPVLPLKYLGISVAEIGSSLISSVCIKSREAEKQDANNLDNISTEHSALTKQISESEILKQACDKLLMEITNHPEDPSLQNRLGLIYLALGETDNAIDQFKRTVDLANNQLQSLTEKSQALAKQGKAKGATALIIEAARLNIELIAAQSSLSLAKISKNPGNTEISSSPFALATTNAETEATTNKLIAQGKSLLQVQHYGEAIQTFKTAININPKMALAHHELGLSYAITGNAQMAVEELETTAKLSPGDAALHNNLALLYQQLGDAEKAQREFETALALNPLLVEAAINLGNMLSAQGKYDRAEQAFEKAILANPQSVAAHNNLATTLSFASNYDRSIMEFQKTLALSPNLASAHLGLGLAFYHSKHYLAAISEFKKALSLDSGLNLAREKLEQAQRKASLATTPGLN